MRYYPHLSMANENLVVTIIIALFSVVLIRPIIYQQQCGGYRIGALFSDNEFLIKRYLPYFLSGLAFTFIYMFVALLASADVRFFLYLAYFALLICIGVSDYKRKLKVPFVFTARATRLYIAETLAVWLLAAHMSLGFDSLNVRLDTMGIFLLPVLTPLISVAALAFIAPLEKVNSERYILCAKSKLANNEKLIKIGITGSFGKTSVKNILYEMLSTTFVTVMTEGNYNTPLGIARTVGNMPEDAEIFIAEMGARRSGDIAELCAIVKPRYGIVTGVTSQHLKTFKSLDNIYREKLSLLDHLPENGWGVLNRKGIERDVDLPEHSEFTGGEGDYCYADNVELTNKGASFTLHLNNKEYSAKTKLLGAHNLQNIVCAAALAYKLEVPSECIVNAIYSLSQVPHRLQIIVNGKVTIIDDTYNSNPVGAKCALDVLKSFDGRRVIVTPGMVELGDKEAEENTKFGAEIAKVCDFVILIGGSALAHIEKGLSDAGFSRGKILTYSTLALAEHDFPSLFMAGDTVLFENDLPDIYCKK